MLRYVSEREITIDQRSLERFCKRHHVASLGLFGSVLTARFRSSSDVDVLVEFKKRCEPDLFALVDMEYELGALIGRPVDLRTPKDLSPHFRAQVQSTAKMLYEG
jgi:uncharacterized protein